MIMYSEKLYKIFKKQLKKFEKKIDKKLFETKEQKE